MFQQSGGPWARLFFFGWVVVASRGVAGGIQYSGALVGLHNGRHGLLDAPPSRGMTVGHHRSANASLAPSAAKPPAKARRSQLIAFGRVTMRSRTADANRP